MAKYITPKEFAEACEVSTDTVLREIERGNIKAFKIGRQFKIEESELERVKSGAALNEKNVMNYLQFIGIEASATQTADLTKLLKTGLPSETGVKIKVLNPNDRATSKKKKRST